MIGSISLEGFGVPQFIRFGGRQRLAVHPLVDGRRIIERLGPDDDEIEFQGTLSGSDAPSRVNELDRLRVSGNIVWLSWGAFRRRVVVSKFVATYQSPWWILYRISCAVAHQALSSTPTVSSLASRALGDINAALAAGANASIPLTPLQNAVSTQDAFSPGSSGQRNALLAAQTMDANLVTRITSGSTAVSEPITLYNDPMQPAMLYTARVALAGTLASTVIARSYVSRIGKTLGDL